MEISDGPITRSSNGCRSSNRGLHAHATGSARAGPTSSYPHEPRREHAPDTGGAPSCASKRGPSKRPQPKRSQPTWSKQPRRQPPPKGIFSIRSCSLRTGQPDRADYGSIMPRDEKADIAAAECTTQYANDNRAVLSGIAPSRPLHHRAVSFSGQGQHTRRMPIISLGISTSSTDQQRTNKILYQNQDRDRAGANSLSMLRS